MTVFSVWAPAAGRADVDVAGRLYPRSPADRPGWWAADGPGALGLAGTDYAFRLDGGEPLPDPRSPRQPYGPAGRSRTYDHAAFAWTDQRWRGAPVPGAVIYELHIGTFTPEGTLDAAIALVAGHPQGAFLAGGTTEVDLARQDVLRPELLVDINNLPLDDVTRALPVALLVPEDE